MRRSYSELRVAFKHALYRDFDLGRPPTDSELDEILLKTRARRFLLDRELTEDELGEVVRAVVPGITKLGGLDYSDLNALLAKLLAQQQR